MGIGLGEEVGDVPTGRRIVLPGEDENQQRRAFRPTFHSSPLLDPDFDIPKSHYGLTLKQMESLGLHEHALLNGSPNPASLSAPAAYSQPLTSASARSVTRMAGGTPAGAGSGGRRSGRAPPDLPSLLLDSRIVYVGMALVPEVTELVVSELLWLNYAAPDKPVFIYVQSTGSQTPDGQAIAVEQEAYAIIDTMDYIAPKKFTIVIGQALGTAALVAMCGTRGCRYALPHARLQLSPPRLNRTWARTSNLMIRANELEDTTSTYVEFMSRATTAPPEVCRKAISRNRWLTPEVAIKAGIIDKVYDNGLGEKLAKERTDYEELMRKRAAAEGKKAGAGGGGATTVPKGLPGPGGPSAGV